jgi:hypothetical protein
VTAAATVALATPPAGVLFNRILAQATTGNLAQEVEIDDWQLELQTGGASDFLVQDVSFAPSGYSGWQSQPGLFICTPIEGSFIFYDSNCVGRRVDVGEVWTEGVEHHAVKTEGSANARAICAYLIKHGMPRRLDQPAPDCAPTTGIP